MRVHGSDGVKTRVWELRPGIGVLRPWDKFLL